MPRQPSPARLTIEAVPGQGAHPLGGPKLQGLREAAGAGGVGGGEAAAPGGQQVEGEQSSGARPPLEQAGDRRWCWRWGPCSWGARQPRSEGCLNHV